MILITDREYAEIVMRLSQLIAAHKNDNRLFNCARLALRTINNANRNRHRRIRQWKTQD